MKTCFKCNEPKRLSEFYPHARMADGHLNKCKECTKADNAKHRYGVSRPKILAYERSRGTRKPEGYNAEYRTRFPERDRARGIVSDAIRRGKLTRQNCFVCGDKAEAHHVAYDMPLDVVWLCSSHHKQVHAMAKAA